MAGIDKDDLTPCGQPMPLFTTMDGEKLKLVRKYVELADSAAADLRLPDYGAVRRRLTYALRIIDGASETSEVPPDQTFEQGKKNETGN